ncbi:MAG: hypothetical protein JW715_06465 [Sedimentisphaerales bacterium]|nr:hypothetical protein [Sedimentisphaerales bacterium]
MCRIPFKKWFWIAFCFALSFSSYLYAKWEPAKGPLITRWAKDVSPSNVHPEYPRPQMVRQNWLNLNGLWEYAIRPEDRLQPEKFDGQILVPFPVESALSGVMKPVGRSNRLWYRRTFEIPEKWEGKRMLLHFGAVDWETTVWINGKEVGTHRGGYDSFSFDITEALNPAGRQELVVGVWDPTNAGYQPRGKQVEKPGGIWYTAVTGIWQTVWLEPVPRTYIRSVRITPDLDARKFSIGVTFPYPSSGPRASELDITVTLKDVDTVVARSKSEIGADETRWVGVVIKNPCLWSPEDPFLYGMEIQVSKDGELIDTVRSYAAMRKIEVKKDESGINRLFLNNKPLFQYGPLDQGWWPDGLYTAPTDEALRYDIEVTKKLGMNMARKHVKIEPDRWYYWCDRLGLLVWQDMPNGDRHIGGNDADLKRGEESARQFELELERVIETLYNHPCIVMWVPFNEGWGQYDTQRIVDLVKKYDPTRLVNNASGWSDRGIGDVHDIHSYPGPAAPPVEENRAAVLGEFGGLGLPLKGHTWQDEKNWGYRSYTNSQELCDAYLALVDNLRSLIADGLSAAVYTQTTDVEIEVNGLMTYDRAIIKMDAEKIAAASRRLYLPPPIIKTIVPASQEQRRIWRYTTNKPLNGWQNTDFNDSSWLEGPGGFGTEGTPGAVVRTKWRTSDIWLRRTFELEDVEFDRLQLYIHHDEDAEVYINGRLIAKLEGYTTSYLRITMDEAAKEALKVGKNSLAVHCRQTTGGQYIDAGLADVIEQ